MLADDPVAVGNRRLIERFEARGWVVWVDRGLGPQVYTTNAGDIALGAALGVEI